MSLEELKALISSLALSQGAYGRLKKELDENDSWDLLLDAVNTANCKDSLDVIMYIEG